MHTPKRLCIALSSNAEPNMPRSNKEVNYRNTTCDGLEVFFIREHFFGLESISCEAGIIVFQKPTEIRTTKEGLHRKVETGYDDTLNEYRRKEIHSNTDYSTFRDKISKDVRKTR